MENNHWVLFFHSGSDHYGELYNLLERHNITPAEFAVYGNTRSFLASSGLPLDKDIAFLNGQYIGTYDDVATYLTKHIHDKAA